MEPIVVSFKLELSYFFIFLKLIELAIKSFVRTKVDFKIFRSISL